MKTASVIYCVVTVIVILVATYFIYKNFKSANETFQITSGMITPQRRFYGKCIDDCWRNFTGDSVEGQFNWLCTDECEKKAAMRAEVGLPDISEQQHERHNPANIVNPLKMSESTVNGIINRTASSCPGRDRPDPPYWLTSRVTNNAMWRPGIYGENEVRTFGECYCKAEVKDWCEQIVCPHSSNMRQCSLDCQRTRAINCRGGLDWNWKP